MNPIFFPPEWYPQSAIQLTWPHPDTDWDYMLEEVTACYVNIAVEILKRQKLIVVCHNAETVKYELKEYKDLFRNFTLVELPTNDTWARDHSGISVINNGKKQVYDFTFNGWGLKFASNYDNQISRGLFKNGIFKSDVELINKKDFALEGGALESDGKGTLLTTSECLLSANRNSFMSKDEIEKYLKEVFGLNKILWLNHGYLSGDDTDSHIDTLARYCDEHTIVYVKCENKKDEHYEALAKMEEQLKTFTDYQGNPYKLISLPMAKAVYDEDNERLPATYANFLIMNDVVLLPFYNDQERDTEAKEKLEIAFPTREIIGIDCSSLIRQHGSLHCITMQYPDNFV
ncbi:MAG: agmatine deiminase family protein [Dysgonomonas mossii]|uniref:agmatine deiminase family protein n=1 Tax=Dysgonomonas mossii TaxID=163665 RepID=UPI001DA59376|nr:agmatine deiminase family protein [Dysgonomonas mossii]MBS5796768.1 agmatine deiminase family protein [Dysgonomonas mossii]MBS7112064.1 agmatine deiminase family protein [Dysgonomonas mossii]